MDQVTAASLRLGLNGTALLSPLTGIGQYTRNLAQALARDASIDLSLFYGAGWSREIRANPIRNIAPLKEVVKRVVPYPYAISRFIYQRKFASGMRERQLKLYHEPNFLSYSSPVPTVITAHDLSWLRFPETHPRDRVAVMKRLFPVSLKQAAHVITDAAYTRDELIAEFNVEPSKVTAIGLGARGIFHPRSADACAAVLAQHRLRYRSFILCVGTLEPRKNLQLAVRAYAALPASFRSSVPMVLVGMKGWLSSGIENVMRPLVAAGDVRMLGFADDATLAVLYSGARMLVYPSLYEGFGLPPLEAMASGTPVIVSNRSTLPEVVGSAGLLIEPTDVESLMHWITRLREDETFWSERAAASLTQAAKFSWERCAAETTAIYRRVVA